MLEAAAEEDALSADVMMSPLAISTGPVSPVAAGSVVFSPLVDIPAAQREADLTQVCMPALKRQPYFLHRF